MLEPSDNQRGLREYCIRAENIRLFLEAVADAVTYGFSEADWDAVEYGLGGTDREAGVWYGYTLYGSEPCVLQVAKEGRSGRVCVSLEAPAEEVLRLAFLQRLLSQFDSRADSLGLEALAAELFGSEPLPAGTKLMGCTESHLAACEECQEAAEIFGRRSWREVADAGVPRGYADLHTLTDEAARYFFPAYLVSALRMRHPEILEDAQRVLEGKRIALAPEQQMFVRFVSDRLREASRA